MAEFSHICTNCGYEGKPINPPSDEAYEGQSDSSKAIARIANLILPGLGLIIRPLAMFVTLPLRIVLWVVKKQVAGGPKHCPNCGLPTMVRLKSDAGWIAKRKLDIKLGLVIIGEDGIARTGTGNVVPTRVFAPLPDPGKLGHVDELLRDAPVHTVEMDRTKKEEVVEKPSVETVTKKPVDPEQW